MVDLFSRRLAKLYVSKLLSKQESFSGTDVQTFRVQNGSRLLIFLDITSLTGTLSIEIKNAADRRQEFKTILDRVYETGQHIIPLTDFHKFFTITIDVSGGSSDYSLGATLADNSSAPETIDKEITEVQNSQLTFVGKSLDPDADTSDASWQIKRILTQGNTTTIQFAASGEYNQVWDDREDLFPTPVLTNPASLLFNGTSDEVDFGDNYTFGPATAFSWSIWMKAQNFSAHRRFISKVTQDTNVYGYNFGHDNTGKLWAQFRAPTTLRSHTFNSTLTSGVWYHICFTYAGGSNMNGLKAYINGTVENAVPSASLAAWTVTDPLTIGSRGGTFFFSGNLNQPSIFNKELSQAEVTALYNSGAPGDLNDHSAVANILSWWYFNTADNFPTEVDVIGSVNGTLDAGMSASSYDDGDVP